MLDGSAIRHLRGEARWLRHGTIKERVAEAQAHAEMCAKIEELRSMVADFAATTANRLAEAGCDPSALDAVVCAQLDKREWPFSGAV